MTSLLGKKSWKEEKHQIVVNRVHTLDCICCETSFQGPFSSRKKEGLWERVECCVTNFLQKLAGSENFAEAEFRQITEVLLP